MTTSSDEFIRPYLSQVAALLLVALQPRLLWCHRFLVPLCCRSSCISDLWSQVSPPPALSWEASGSHLYWKTSPPLPLVHAVIHQRPVVQNTATSPLQLFPFILSIRMFWWIWTRWEALISAWCRSYPVYSAAQCCTYVPVAMFSGGLLSALY